VIDPGCGRAVRSQPFVAAVKGMSVNLRSLVPALLAGLISFSAAAAQYACPDLASAAQVNACPTEEELKHTYTAFCSDNAKVYAKETDSCLHYKDYRQMKNVALWESKDGVFDSYVSCDLTPAKVKALKATGMKISTQGKLTKVVCSYPSGISFTYRTKAVCAIADDKACAADAANCQATCN
jgi:hypothetical protein